jgi:hypothetical protein
VTDTVVRSPASDPARTEGRRPLVDGWSLVIVVLSAVQPFARYLDANAKKIVWPGAVIVDAVLWVALMLAAFVAIRAVTRRSTPVAIAAGFVVFNLSFWNFFRWLPYEPATEANRWLAILVWIVVTGIGIRLAAKLASLRYTATFIVIFLGIWTAALLVSAVQGRSTIGTGDPLVVPATEPVAFAGDRPNVYWFLLDEHARTDALKRITGSDNSWFGDDLTDRGFSVSSTSTASYLQTHLSVTSTLAMADIWEPGKEYRGEYALAAPLLTGDNPVVETFEANGYRYVGAPDGKMEWSNCPEPAETRACIEPEGGPFALREPHSFLVYSTPVGSLGLPSTHNDTTSIRAGIDELWTDDQPFFLYAHLLTPHFPFRYEQDCSERRPWVDGYNYSREQRDAAYANDVQCLDHDMVDLVDHILANDPDAVIIIQSDHGSALEFSSSVPIGEQTPELLHERFGVLDAIRLPEPCRGDDIEGQPLVNTFRLVFACLEGTDPELLEARHFYPADTEQTVVRSFLEVDIDDPAGS